MKWIVVICLCIAGWLPARGQQEEIQQLLLNWQKLEQMKQILSDMKAGYEIISKGYGMIRDISSGNFSLHQIFLDKMLEVSPMVRGYYKVGEIVSFNLALAKEYKNAIDIFGSSEWLRADEIAYMREMFGVLNKRSLELLSDLSLIITAGKMRMTDDERLTRIDRIHYTSRDLLVNCRRLNREASKIIYERSGAVSDLEIMGLLQGVDE